MSESQNTLLDLVKNCLSIISTSTIKDSELNMWINAGKKDLERQGITVDATNELIQSAIVMYVKGNFGNVDIKEKQLAQATYNLLCVNLSLSATEEVE